VNCDAVAELGRLAARHDRYVLHIGTDFVFAGDLDRPYAETDLPQPLSVYGATKLAGETALQVSGCRHAIVRVQWTYGANGNHFIRKLVERAAQSAELKVVADQVGAPTWTHDVARLLTAMLAQQTTGLFHYAATGYTSRFEVAQFALHELGLACRLVPCRTADFPTPARRPLNSRFDCRRIDSLFPGCRRPWEEAVREFLKEQPTSNAQRSTPNGVQASGRP
jgi:dTDP-4-dehydrorhamnose reductase